MENSKIEITLVAAVMLVLGLIFTYPLIFYFNTGIPYAHYSDNHIPELKSGDHLQLYYWFWILKDNIFGGSPLFSNPYEFNMIGKQVPLGFHMFPFSLFFLIFTPFGDIFAFNATFILSFILAGVSAYLLVKNYTGSKSSAMIAAIIFAIAPFRISQLTGSHLNGFNFFFFPLIIYLYELSRARVSFIYGLLCGLMIFFISIMDSHLTYYLFVFLGVYIPLGSLLTIKQKGKESETSSSNVNLPQWLNLSKGRYLLISIGAGILLVIFSQMILTHDYDIPFFNRYLFYSLMLYPALFVLLGIFIASLFYLLTPLMLNQAFAICATSYLPLYLVSLYVFKLFFDIPYLAKILIILSFGLMLFFKISLFLKYYKQGSQTILNCQRAELKKIIFPLIPIILFMLISLLYILSVKTRLLESSIAREGRTFHDISLYSPYISDIFQRINPYVERHIYLGIIPLFLAIYVQGSIISIICNQRVDNAEEKVKLVFLSFLTFAFLLSYILCLGLSFGELSLYKLFYYYFPYFNFSRSPGRIIIITFLALSIIAGYAVKELQIKFKTIKKEKIFTALFVALTFGIVLDYHPFKPVAITTLTDEKEVYKYIKKNINDTILLELPLWPGDSHQSSLYEYFITQDQVKRVNGYSPIVSKEYLDTIFYPLYTLNSGKIDNRQYELLNKLNVKYITIHNNQDVFPAKVSPYPPLYTVRRFMNSPFVDFVRRYEDIYLFKVKGKFSLIHEEVKKLSGSSVISNIYGIDRLQNITGDIFYDGQINNKVLQGSAKNNSKGYLTYGPYVNHPKGKYLIYYRLKAMDNMIEEPVARIEVSAPYEGKETVIVQKDIKGIDFSKPGKYQDFYLYIDLAELTRLEFRTYFYKKTDIAIEKVVVSMFDQKNPAPYFEAESLSGNTGEVVKDNQASGGKAIFADTKTHLPDYLIYGPQRKYPPGKYRVFYKMKIDQSGAKNNDANIENIATIDVTSDNDRNILASRSLNSIEFSSDNYHFVPLDFVLDRENELSFRVKFGKKTDIWVDRVEINLL